MTIEMVRAEYEVAIKGGSQLQQQQQRKKTKKEPTRKSGGVKPQTVQTQAPWQAGNEDFATFKAEIQQMMQQMMQQQQQQMQQVQLQVTELRSSIRKQKFTENIREKAYHRPALASLADTSANNTEA
nr:ras guanine nucleotide exchange factor B-like [Dermacentor andersoni]